MIYINNYREKNKFFGDDRNVLIWGLFLVFVYFLFYLCYKIEGFVILFLIYGSKKR